MDQRKQPITVEILSDGDGLSPSPLHIDKKRKVDVNDPPLLVLIDDPTPQKPTPSFVPDTPLEEYKSSIVKCTTKRSRFPSEKISGITSLICLESDNESDGGSEGYSLQRNKLTASRENLENGSFRFGIHEEGLCKDTESSLKTSLVQNMSVGIVNSDTYCESHITYGKNLAKEKGSTTVQFYRFGEKCNQTLEIAQESVRIIGGDPSCSRFSYEDDVPQKKDTTFEKSDYIQDEELDINLKKPQRNGARVRKKQSKEEIAQINNERKLQREQDKLRKEALKADTLKMKKLLKETEKWAKGKFAIKSIVAEIDTKVVEIGSIGGHLLSRFSEKGLSFRITSNPIEGSILWKMNIPDEIVQVTAIKSQIPYILLVFEAEQFCNLVHDESLMEHIHKVQGLYPSFTVCCLTNKLMSYINKREQAQYKNPSYDRSWSRPEVEKALSKLTTHFAKVHSRQCIDEAELAEHVVGLTCSLATCQFRKKLTRLSVNANGTLVSKDFIDKGLIKKSVWLKALVAIPKVQPRFAIAIWKKYPNMRSLLNEYLDPKKSVHEKEFLLKDLMVEGLLGKENRRVGEVCSKRIYRIMMAQNGGIRTDDIEDGADFFTS